MTGLKFPKPTKRKKSEYRRAMDRADEWFSKFIRLRDGNRCFTCGQTFKHMEAGHFMGRGFLATRYDERNVHAQCRHCNQFLEGNLPAYEEALDRKYGNGFAGRLKIKCRVTVKYTSHDLRKIANFYRGKVKELENEVQIKTSPGRPEARVHSSSNQTYEF